MIPRFDLNDYRTDKSRFAAAFGKAFHDFGFVVVGGHGVPPETLRDADKQVRAFFSLPAEIKNAYDIPDTRGLLGYSGPNKEKALGAAKPDLKEDWFIRTRLPTAHPCANDVDRLLNVPELPLFKPAALSLFAAFEGATRRVMQPLSVYMGQEQNWFDDKFDRSHSSMRLLYYPQGGNAGSHLDMNFLTWLNTDEPGLYVTARDGQEYAIEPQKGDLILNGGMQLGLLTNNDLRPSWHRVDAPNPRHTIVFFVHPNPDFNLAALPKFAGSPPEPRPDYFPPADAQGRFSVTVEDFVRQQVEKTYKPEEKRGPRPG